VASASVSKPDCKIYRAGFGDGLIYRRLATAALPAEPYEGPARWRRHRDGFAAGALCGGGTRLGCTSTVGFVVVYAQGAAEQPPNALPSQAGKGKCPRLQAACSRGMEPTRPVSNWSFTGFDLKHGLGPGLGLAVEKPGV
jgi:hypothetical protein